MDWFLHDGDPHREKLKALTILSYQLILDSQIDTLPFLQIKRRYVQIKEQ